MHTRHSRVAVQVVGHDIGDDRHVRAALQRDQPLQLPARQLQDNPAIRLDARQRFERRTAEIAGDDERPAVLPDDGGEQQRGRGLALGACHTDDLPARTLREKERHLHDHRHAGRRRHLQVRRMARHGRIADHEVCGSKVLFPMLPQHVGDREVGQGVQRSGQLLGGSEIGHGNVRAALGQKSGHAYAATVDAQPHHERAPAAILHRSPPLRRPLDLHGRPPPPATAFPNPGYDKVLGTITLAQYTARPAHP